MSAIAIRPDTSTGKKEENEIDVVPATHSFQYILCGLGANCSIKGGKASTARHALLRREALELALYTFKYVRRHRLGLGLPAAAARRSVVRDLRLPQAERRRGRSCSKPLADSIGAEDADDRQDAEEGARARQPHHGAAALLVRVPAGAGRERRADLRPGRPRRLSRRRTPGSSRPRSGSTASTGGRSPVRIDARPALRHAVVLPPALALDASTATRSTGIILLRSARRLGRPRHARALPRLADAAPAAPDAAQLPRHRVRRRTSTSDRRARRPR